MFLQKRVHFSQNSKFEISVNLHVGCLFLAQNQILSNVLDGKLKICHFIIDQAHQKSIYIIEFGSVEVEIENSVILGSGEYFGETGLVSEEKRNATISVVEEAKLLKLSKDSLNELIEEYPSLFEDLKTSASSRTG